MNDSEESIVTITDISYSYPKVNALNGVSMRLNKKGIYGLLGPNGAGKTTLMKVMLGFLQPGAGTGKILGHDLHQASHRIRKHVGYMPESDCLIPGMDAVGETVYLARISGMSKTEAIKRAHEVLFYVGLEEERYRMVETYSTGMKQRLKLAQALVHDPELLLLDEPTSGMDPGGRKEMLNLIRDIGEKGGMSILISSHLLADIEATCQRVLIMNRGKLVTDESVRNLNQETFGSYEIEFFPESETIRPLLSELRCRTEEGERGKIKLILPASVPLSELFLLAHRQGVQIRHVKKVQTTLEEAFMKAIGESDGY